MVLVRERTASPQQKRDVGLVGLTPYLKKFVSEESALVYIPGKRYPTQDEIEVYDIARRLGLPAYSMCLERLNRENSISGDFTRFDFKQVSSHPAVVFNGVFSAWSPDGCAELVLRGVRNLRSIMATADLTLLLYVDHDVRRFAQQDSLRDALIGKFIAQAVKSIDDVDAVDFRMRDSRHLLFYR